MKSPAEKAAHKAAYYQRNRRKWTAYTARSNAKRRGQEKYRLYRAAYRQKNAAKIKAYNDEYRQKNRAVYQAAEARRRAFERGSTGSYTAEDVAALYEKQRAQCPVCRASLANGYHVDHVMPFALKGSNGPENIQLLCPPCNMTKHTKHPVVFMREKGFLL